MEERSKKAIFRPVITEELYDDNQHLGIESIVFLYRLAINNLWEELGFPLKYLQEKRELTRMTIESHLQYLGEVTTAKEVRIESFFTRIGNSSYTLSQKICDTDDFLLGTHNQTALFLDNESRKPSSIPIYIKEKMMQYLSSGEQAQAGDFVRAGK